MGETGSARTLALVAALAVAGGGGVWYLTGDREPAPPAGEAPAPQVEPAPESGPPLQAPVVDGRQPPAPESETRPLAHFPNGVTVEPLNGVDGPVKMSWPSHVPWSPVARKVVDEDGMEWYLHEDGSWSTTVMATDKVNNQLVPTGLVFNETPALPLVTDEGQPRVTPHGIVK